MGANHAMGECVRANHESSDPSWQAGSASAFKSLLHHGRKTKIWFVTLSHYRIPDSRPGTPPGRHQGSSRSASAPPQEEVRRHPQTIEQDIVRALEAVYGPYTGTCFGWTGESDIEYIVATNEAHDSGLCAADRAAKRRFATDLRNLTLASPRVNRHQKIGKDAGKWVPKRNRCWFAGRVLKVKRAYGLTVDRREAAELERIFSQCYGTEMELIACTAPSTGTREAGASAPAGDDALARYDDNRNGRITCKEARRHGIAPVPRSHPAYRYMRDGDSDGVVCE